MNLSPLHRAVVGGCVIAALSACGSGSDRSIEGKACQPPHAAPVTLRELVDAFRDESISLEPNALSCELSTGPHATNMGPDGISSEPAVVKAEGRVLCFLGQGGTSRTVNAVRYQGDQETGVSALNVLCTVYPSSPHRESAQVGRVKAALGRLVKDSG